MKLNSKQVLALAAVVFSFNACIGALLAPLDEVVAGSSRRAALLGPTIDNFHKSVYWGSLGPAIKSVSSDIQNTFYQDLRGKDPRIRFADLDVEDTQFNDSMTTADVMVRVRYYGDSSYMVKTRRHKEKWEFYRLGGGWKLTYVDSADRAQPEEDTPGVVAQGGMTQRQIWDPALKDIR